MKHLILCREYPPAPIPPGGIGTYVVHISRLLAERGETVHVIAQRWCGASQPVEVRYGGKLVIHRVVIGAGNDFFQNPLSKKQIAPEVSGLSQLGAIPEAFSWQASQLAEQLVETEAIDLIEAQEYEAPLYFFQLRRALGLGPERTPPCLIHLHSPTEFIVEHNDWNLYHPTLSAIKRLEDYSIVAADALLCPSRYLARQAETHYNLAQRSIHVIPLPIGDNPRVDREPAIWTQGSICYVGRLERRKGILEWIDAAVRVATEYPTLEFEFIGQNCLGTYQSSGDDLIEHRIPDTLKSRFIFHGKQKRTALPNFFKKARIAVIPSRWENFPNTCVEVMCSGLPVLASPEGGMAEMVEEGYTGWIADDASSESLAETLKRAIATPPETLAEMGTQAAIAIRQMCDNQKILDEHLAFRQRVVDQGSDRSLCIPASRVRTSTSSEAMGLAIVVTCLDQQSLEPCLQSLVRQTHAPKVAVVVNHPSADAEARLLQQRPDANWHIIQVQGDDRIAAKTAGTQTILNSGVPPLGFAFLEGHQQVETDYVATCESVLTRCREVGVVSCWTQANASHQALWVKPCPSFPYQWVMNEAAPVSVVRTEALQEAGFFRTVMNQGYEDWDLVNAVLAAGWTAVTIPRILATVPAENDAVFTLPSTHTSGKMYQAILDRFPDLVQRDARAIALLTHSISIRLTQEEVYNHRQQLFLARILLQAAYLNGLRLAARIKLEVALFFERVKSPFRKALALIKVHLMKAVKQFEKQL